eukprot:scaffold350_cov313-Prasinococcus_capsulatus_cf.AAC.8
MTTAVGSLPAARPLLPPPSPLWLLLPLVLSLLALLLLASRPSLPPNMLVGDVSALLAPAAAPGAEAAVDERSGTPSSPRLPPPVSKYPSCCSIVGRSAARRGAARSLAPPGSSASAATERGTRHGASLLPSRGSDDRRRPAVADATPLAGPLYADARHAKLRATEAMRQA